MGWSRNRRRRLEFEKGASVLRALKQILVPVLCASLMLPALPVSAAPLPPPAAKTGAGIVLVYGGHHRHHGVGPAGIIGAIIAGTLIAAAISQHRARPSDMEACDRDFPDFDPETGTYIDRRGHERVCPYLR
jgi:hypothetical protein